MHIALRLNSHPELPLAELRAGHGDRDHDMHAATATTLLGIYDPYRYYVPYHPSWGIPFPIALSVPIRFRSVR